MEEQKIPMIYNALTTAMASINAVGKNSKNEQQGWNFRSIDAVYNALQPALVAAGITIVPKVLEKDIQQDEATKDQYGRSKPGATTARLTMQYTAYAQDGSSVEAVTLGEGRDYGDKACNKAMAIAYKYMAFQLFCIPTEEMRRDDPDFYIPDEQEQKKMEEQPKPSLAQRVEQKVERKTAPAKVTVTSPAAANDRKAALNDLALRIGTDSNGVASAWKALQKAGLIPSKPSSSMTDEEFSGAINALEKNFCGDK